MTEYFDVVDKEDNVIGRASRKECHEKGLIHRLVQILVFNSQGDVLIHKRGAGVDTFPGKLTGSAAGHVEEGESYEKAASRELKEELGIEAPLEKLGFVRSYEKEHMQNIIVFKVISEGPFSKKDSEIAELLFFSIEELKKEFLENPEKFTPAFREIFKLLE